MPVQGSLVGLPSATLTAIINAATAAIQANFARGTSYSIAGRTFTFPSLGEAMKMIQEANYALGLQTGNVSTMSRANFNITGMGRGAPFGNAG